MGAGLRVVVAMLVALPALALVPQPVTAPGAWCAANTPYLFCDDFNPPNAGWTTTGNGLTTGTGSTAAGLAYNPNDWHQSNRGCGDTAAKYVGVVANGEEVGYFSPQPFGFFLGFPPAWYQVRNNLISPIIDATGVTTTTFDFKVRGSSEGTSNPPFDFLRVYIQVVGGPLLFYGQYAGYQYQSACTMFSFPAAGLSGNQFQIIFEFTMDSNTDSLYIMPCMPAACADPALMPPAVMCPSALGGGCLYGGMGWWVDDVIVRRLNVLPNALFSVQAGPDCATKLFTDLSTDSDGTIVSWFWDFGDGGTSTLQNPSHTYLTSGVYTVVLTVTDNDGGVSTYTMVVTVVCITLPPPPPPPPPPPGAQAPHEVVPGREPPRDGIDAEVSGIDTDGDGTPDSADSCPYVSDPGQPDFDLDGLGDACDDDMDGDGIPNGADNCILTPNTPQLDSDFDSTGDACDPDTPVDPVTLDLLGAGEQEPAAAKARTLDAVREATAVDVETRSASDALAPGVVVAAPLAVLLLLFGILFRRRRRDEE